MKTAEYFSAIRAQRVALDAQYPNGTVHLTAVANSASVTEAATDTDARCLIERTHRISSPNEVAQWREHQERNRQASQSTEYLLRGQRVIWGGGGR
jgi:hypothetical protein